jgi:glycosyltransferase involved in cell wall biosynthesis
VVIPTFNRGRYLRDAIDSVFDQRARNVQVIVIDDGSTDDTAAVVAAYGERVEYHRQPNLGTAYARNRGLAVARGRYVSFLDSDDIWLPGKLDAELEVFRTMPQADAVISDSEAWREGKLMVSSWFRDRGLSIRQGSPKLVSQLPPLWIKSKLFATCCLTLKLEVLRWFGERPFDTSLRTHEDWDFSIRLFHRFDVAVLPKVCARVRRFDDGTRKGRPLPGTAYPPEVRRVMEQRRYHVLRKAARLEGWPAAVTGAVADNRTEAALNVAESYRGWRRPGVLSLAVAETARGAAANALAVIALSLMPQRFRPAVREMIANAAAKQRSVPARAGV